MHVSTNKKIALFVPTLRGGGAERIMINLARGFIQLGIDVDLVVRAEGIFISDVPDSVRLINLHTERMLTTLPRLIQYLRREKPDAMLSAIEHTCIAALIAAQIAKVNTRMIVTVHNTLSLNRNENLSIARFVMPMLMKKLYPKANAIVVVSEAARDDFLRNFRLNRKKVSVIYNPVVTPELFEKAKQPSTHPWLSQDSPPVILGVGRLTKQKDFTTLIRAFALVCNQQPAKLIIIGEGNERKKLEQLSINLRVSKDVDIHGFVENSFSYMANAAVFVLSSAWEGLPTALIEALAIGTPIVSTDCPSGPREILKNGEYGSLVSIGDENQIAQSILSTLREPRRKVPDSVWEQFGQNTVTKQYLNIMFNEPTT